MSGAHTTGSGGTAPGDRTFRPDIQGLRAVAILLVVLYHAGLHVSGGYVGVDVFFVVSGFVITGVLLRERTSKGTTSIPAFYARRARRIIPAATLVIIVVVLVARHMLGPVVGGATANDGRWAAAFFANFHFATSGANYLASQRPPSPLQNYWSLAVEEQFYLVYPALFVVTAIVWRRVSLQAKLAVGLVGVIVASFAYSVVETSSNATAAYFSPFTRAWELALGALLAVGTRQLQRLPGWLAAALSWTGMTAIIVAAFAFGSGTAYPGAAVAVPVLGAGLIIAAGAAHPARSVESVLRLAPFQWLGQISYSLYLWHWPVLIIAAERRDVLSLPVVDNGLLLVLATALAVATYFVVENPIRNFQFFRVRQWASVGMGATLVASGLLVSASQVQAVSLGLSTIDSAQTGNLCPSPPADKIASLRTALKASDPVTPPLQRDPVSVMVAGDSTACGLLPGIEAVAPLYHLRVTNTSVVGCGIVSDEIIPYVVNGLNLNAGSRRCRAEVNTVELSALQKARPDIVLWVSIWERNSLIGPDGILIAGSRQWQATLMARMNKRVLQFDSVGAKTVIVLQPPASGGPLSTALTRAQPQVQLNNLLTKFAALHPADVSVVDLGTRICPKGPPCPIVVDGVDVRPDGFHLSPESATFVAQWLVPRVLSSARR